MRGRKPQPTALKLIQGNPGRRKLPKNEPKFAVDNPKAPAHLSKQAKLEWNHFVSEMAAKGVVTTADYSALLVRSDAYEDYLAARAIVTKEGRTVTFIGSTGYDVTKKHPAYEVMADAWKRFVDLTRDFGGTPSSRSRVTTAEPVKEADPFEAFLGKKGK